eukprot:TRINITY_DN65063_c0_g1_i1.p1 TRINITY_DN65063_c0_g1~~TRINITY_DN65063_c0_g1_i1.p1  ORF type:complete len:1086 (+),score=255.85 TRINITY_DN65063_c0_g1_i1:102-3359(+)
MPNGPDAGAGGETRCQWLRVYGGLRSRNADERASAARQAGRAAEAGGAALAAQVVLALARLLSTERDELPRRAALGAFKGLLAELPEVSHGSGILGTHFAEACHRTLLGSVGRRTAVGDATLQAASALLAANAAPTEPETAADLAALAVEVLDVGDEDEERYASRNVMVELLTTQPPILNADLQDKLLASLATCAERSTCSWFLCALEAARGAERRAVARALCCDILEQHAGATLLAGAKVRACDGPQDGELGDDNQDIDATSSGLQELVVAALRVSTRLAVAVPGILHEQVEMLAKLADRSCSAEALCCLDMLAQSRAAVDSLRSVLSPSRLLAWLERSCWRPGAQPAAAIGSTRRDRDRALLAVLRLCVAVLGSCSSAQASEPVVPSIRGENGVATAASAASAEHAAGAAAERLERLRSLDRGALRAMASADGGSPAASAVASESKEAGAGSLDLAKALASVLTELFRPAADENLAPAARLAAAQAALAVAEVSGASSEPLRWLVSWFHRGGAAVAQRWRAADRRALHRWLRGRFARQTAAVLARPSSAELRGWLVERLFPRCSTASSAGEADPPPPEALEWLAAALLRALETSSGEREFPALLCAGAAAAAECRGPAGVLCWAAVLRAARRAPATAAADNARAAFRTHLQGRDAEDPAQDGESRRLAVLSASEGGCDAEEGAQLLLALVGNGAGDDAMARMELRDLARALSTPASLGDAPSLRHGYRYPGLRRRPLLRRCVLTRALLRRCCADARAAWEVQVQAKKRGSAGRSAAASHAAPAEEDGRWQRVARTARQSAAAYEELLRSPPFCARPRCRSTSILRACQALAEVVAEEAGQEPTPKRRRRSSQASAASTGHHSGSTDASAAAEALARLQRESFNAGLAVSPAASAAAASSLGAVLDMAEVILGLLPRLAFAEQRSPHLQLYAEASVNADNILLRLAGELKGPGASTAAKRWRSTDFTVRVVRRAAAGANATSAATGASASSSISVESHEVADRWQTERRLPRHSIARGGPEMEEESGNGGSPPRFVAARVVALKPLLDRCSSSGDSLDIFVSAAASDSRGDVLAVGSECVEVLV